MKKVLVAGASGYLGKYVVSEFKMRGYWVRALVRNPDKLKVTGPYLEPAVNNVIDEIIIGDVTKPETLSGICKDIDIVFSSIGITKPTEKASFMDVDYLGNKILLEEALRESVEKFIFVSVFNGERFTYIEAIKAKEMFVKELESSGINYTVIRPTGFFSDMSQFLQMAIRGRVYLIGNGENVMNPIHGADVAKICVDAVDIDEKDIPVGGPEILKYVDIAKLAFSVLGKKPKITRIPAWLIKFFALPLRIMHKNYYVMMKFLIAAMTNNFVAPAVGTHRLKNYFEELKNHWLSKTSTII